MEDAKIGFLGGIVPPGFTTMRICISLRQAMLVEAPLRFKMPPSPVPLRELLANADPMPSPERLNRYRQIMLRWYQRIEAVGENGRMQTRSRCPEPPANIVDLRVSCDIEALLSWSSVCCRWWDETSRKRSRRGHRSGRGAWAGGRDGTLARGQVSAQTQAHSERQDQTQAQSQSGLASADALCPNWVHDLLNDE
ncbi:unnamed protein product [Trypanosoma congolense IL3000]|uniref:WGS project CAEQ00000000 data, annotated contig 471 n=1 Tax=Trypanosoma congolense (strain IL3000) TaxID=1068625 RepID=F9WG69_TRYCI|nr:unnamed protein product [Trypanosoma congolense IL3000]